MSAVEKILSPDDYLQWERAAEFKSEYHRGTITLMAGASRNHNRVSANLSVEIGVRLKNSRCQHFSQDFRLWIPTEEFYTYPDLTIVCGKLELLDDQFDTMLNPTTIIEVLSKSTAQYDRSEKFEYYRSIPSFKEYVLIDSERVKVEVWQKLESPNVWALVHETRRLDDSIQLMMLPSAISLQDIYAQTVGLLHING
ncbi:Uma2 family endonuclease [Runella sp. SP2]|uniref:Uma2 family endonuclease n=1 Tax=Runella sp. SP2 TaxID=2268026 RepID=UPI000F091F1B|nr:Uma2 family endonuclease [Runella sp. SP2]AYQ36004.1 Uma2 family endonuclease [Runella sp. SP2]